MLSKKSLYNSALIRGNWKRFWPLMAIYSFIYLVAIFGFCQNKLYAATDISDFSISFGTLVTFAAAPIAALAMFQWLWKSSSSDFYHSLPLKREGLFITSYSSGLMMLTLPQVFMSFCFLFIAIPKGGAYVKDVFLGLWLLIALTIFFYSLSSLCAIISGNVVTMLVIYGLLNFISLIVQGIMSSYLPKMIFGFEYRLSFSTVLSPVAEIVGNSYSSSTHLPGYISLLFVAGLILVVGSMLTMRRRRVETAGEVVAFQWLRPLFKYTLTFLFAILGSMLFELMFGKAFIPLLYEVVFATLTYFGCEMLLQKSVRVFKNGYKGYLVCIAVMYVLFLCTALDVFGYESYVPQMDQIQAVSITSGDYYSVNNSIDKEDFTNENTPYIFREEENISKGISAHRWILDNRSAIKRSKGDSRYEQYYYVKYLLRSGRIVERTYVILNNYESLDLEEIIYDLSNSSENIENRFAPYPGFKKAWISYVSVDGLRYHGIIGERIYDAMLSDAREGRIDVEKSMVYLSKENIDSNSAVQISITLDTSIVEDVSGMANNSTMNFVIDKNAIDTMELIGELKY